MSKAQRLFEIRLPDGTVPGFDVAGHNENGQRYYPPPPPGFDGYRFIGAGRGKTRIRPAPGIWTNIFVETHPGIVRFESLSIHGRGRAALMAGRPQQIDHKFGIELEDFELVAEDPAPGQRSSVTWGLFTYSCGQKVKHGEVWYGPSTEHTDYLHGSNALGAEFEDVDFNECGAQHIKLRPDPLEVPWGGKGVVVSVKRCKFKRWYQPWSNRGGGAIVSEGGGCRWIIDSNEFLAPSDSAMHTRCIMLDDAKGAFYDPVTGRVGQGFAHEHVIIRNNGFQAGPGSENLSPVIRVGGLGSGQKVAKSLLIDGNAIYGTRLQLQLGDIPTGKTIVRGNNTAEIEEYAFARGYDVSREALIPLAHKVIQVSEGLVR